jgi:hypothetical protein
MLVPMTSTTTTERGGGASQSGSRLAGWSLVAAMAAGSVVMWLGVPLGLLYAVSATVKTTQPTAGPYLLIVVGVPLGMAVVGRGLGALDRRYAAVTARDEGRRQAAWLRSMRGDRGDAGRWEVLDVVMVWSVGTALLAFAVWFFVFAGSSLPGT